MGGEVALIECGKLFLVNTIGGITSILCCMVVDGIELLAIDSVGADADAMMWLHNVSMMNCSILLVLFL